MLREIPITAARHELTSLPERLAKEPGAVAVTRRGKPVLAVMPWELYESIIRQGIEDIEEGKTFSWETVKAELGL